MWFKNLIAYRLPDDWSATSAELEQKLAQRCLLPCGAFDMQSKGWVFPTASERYAHTVNSQHLIAMGVDEKVLPAAVIKQTTTERAKALADEQGYAVGRRQMRELKMRITEELRGRALTRKRITHAWIDPVNRRLVVDASSAGKAEALVELLRETWGSFAVSSLEPERTSAAMTAWLVSGDAPLTFTIDDDLELQAADGSKPTIRYQRHALDGKEIRAQINAGMYATRLGLTWKDRVSFVLTEALHVRKTDFLLLDELQDGETGEPVERLDADFTLMTGELSALLGDLQRALGEPSQRSMAA